VVLGAPDAPAVARREGSRVLVEVADATPQLALPPPQPPIVRMAFEPARGAGVCLVLELSGPADYEVVRDGRELRLLFAARPADDELAALAQALFPAERPAAGASPLEETRGEAEEPRVRLRPTASALYASGSNGFEDGPQPSADSYYEIAPRLEALGGPLRLSYEAHLRGGSRHSAVNSTTTHLFDSRLERQLAGDTHLSAHYQFLRGRQQTREVDPGGEYFYGLERFRKHTADLSGRVSLGGATSLVCGGEWSRVTFDERRAFTDYSGWSAHGGLRREIGGQTALELRYTRGEVYAADDPDVAGTTVDAVDASLTGEIRPMLNVHLSAGFGRRESPGAPSAARESKDLQARASIRRELSDSAAITVGYVRARNISAFEGNPSYRTDGVDVQANAPLPFRLSAAASAGWQQNLYPLAVAAIGAPRRDRIYGWALGVGRSLGSRVVAHVEYRWSRRDSNLPGLSSVSDGFVAQVDVTPLREGPR
jgi:hypothetical protein